MYSKAISLQKKKKHQSIYLCASAIFWIVKTGSLKSYTYTDLHSHPLTLTDKYLDVLYTRARTQQARMHARTHTDAPTHPHPHCQHTRTHVILRTLKTCIKHGNCWGHKCQFQPGFALASRLAVFHFLPIVLLIPRQDCSKLLLKKGKANFCFLLH